MRSTLSNSGQLRRAARYGLAPLDDGTFSRLAILVVCPHENGNIGSVTDLLIRFSAPTPDRCVVGRRVYCGSGAATLRASRSKELISRCLNP